MEPRPPRPRSPHQFDAPGTSSSPGIGERLYPNPAEPAYYSEAYDPGMVGQPPLLPRQQRRQRGAMRGVIATLVVVAVLLALGWLFRDTIRGFIAPTPPPTVIAVTDNNSAAPGTPLAEPTSAALPNALATVTPTAAAASTATPRPAQGAEATEAPAAPAAEEGEPDRDISAQTQPLLDLLPTLDQVPAGMILSDEAERSKADVLQALGGTDEAAQHLEDWGWSGNAYRDFIVPEDGVPPPTGTTYINTSVHRFADAESAANALIFYSDLVVNEQGLQEVEAPAIGESARLLQGAPGGVPLAILYVQNGPILYRLGGSTSSAEGDPTTDVLSVATAIIPSQSAGDGT